MSSGRSFSLSSSGRVQVGQWQGSRESTTETIVLCEEIDSAVAEEEKVLVLRLEGSKKESKVTWEEGTIDNEHLCRKSSKSKSPMIPVLSIPHHANHRKR